MGIPYGVNTGAGDAELLEISGWHPDPRYLALRVEGIRAVADALWIATPCSSSRTARR